MTPAGAPRGRSRRVAAARGGGPAAARRPVTPALALCGLLLAGCGGGGGAARPRLVELRRFGQDSIPASGIDARTRKLGAGVLADITGVATDPAGRVYVLDRDWKKIAVFAPDGRFQTVLGGPGAAPGEFRLPVHLATNRRGTVSVLDYELGRVTFFDGDSLAGATPLDAPGALRHALMGDGLMVTGDWGRDAPIVRAFGPDGERVGEAPAQEPQDRPFGSPVGIAAAGNETLLVSTRRPGVWMERRAGRWLRVGEPLYPKMAPPRRDAVRAGVIRETPARATAGSIAAVGGGRVVQGYMRLPRPFDWSDPPRRDEAEWYLAVFRDDGTRLGVVRLPAGVRTPCMYADPRTHHLFLCTTKPYPQVIEYALEP